MVVAVEAGRLVPAAAGGAGDVGAGAAVGGVWADGAVQAATIEPSAAPLAAFNNVRRLTFESRSHRPPASTVGASAPELGGQDGPQCEGGLAVRRGLTMRPAISRSVLVQGADCFELLPQVGDKFGL